MWNPSVKYILIFCASYWLCMYLCRYLVLEVKTKTYSLVSLQDKSGVTVGTASVGLGLGLGFEPSVFGNPGQS